MIQIILVRHGETDWNVEQVFRGRIDIELNEVGIKQVGLLAEYLSDKKIMAVYSSPLQRALQTAEGIAHYHKLKAEITPGLVDCDFGEWQGLAHQVVKDRYKDVYTEWLASPNRIRVPGGESLDEVGRRATSVVQKVVSKYKGVVVLVSHRVVNKLLICALLGLDNSHFWNIKQDTCGMTTFIYENNQFILAEHNNTSYLKPILKASLNDF